MKKTTVRILGALTLLSTCFVGTFLYSAYTNYTCRGCMTIPCFEDAQNNNALIAIYKATSPPISDTLYLSKALIHGNGYQYYSDDFFPGITGKLKNRIDELRSDRYLTSYVDGKNSGYGLGLKVLPKTITCYDSTGKAVVTFKLNREFSENAIKGRERSYIREWITILKVYK